MNRFYISHIIIGLLPISLAVHVYNPKNPDSKLRASWGYTSSNGPSTWSTTYSTCGGSSQSPIAITDSGSTSTYQEAFSLSGYSTRGAGQITNNDHTLSFSFTDGNAPTMTGGRLPDGVTFKFAQLHWHWGSDSTQGSEHTLEGTEYPMEVHLVHYNTKYSSLTAAASESDGLAVLGFFYEVSSSDNGALDAITDKISSVVGVKTSVSVDESLQLSDFMLDSLATREYYYYKGSLTTPTCDESVYWTVFADTVKISESQLTTFRTLTSSAGVTLNDNYRPPQSLNGRTVYKRVAYTSLDTAASLGLAGVGLATAAAFFAAYARVNVGNIFAGNQLAERVNDQIFNKVDEVSNYIDNTLNTEEQDTDAFQNNYSSNRKSFNFNNY